MQLTLPIANRNVFERVCLLPVAMILIACVSSCSEPPRGGPRVKVVPLSGMLLVNGQPAKDAFVRLHPVVADGGSIPNPGVASQAQVDSEGKFTISSYEGGDGAPPGEYRISITWNYPSGLTLNQWGGPDRLNGQYADPKQTGVTVTVKDEGGADFKLDQQVVTKSGKKINLSTQNGEEDVGPTIEIEAELLQQKAPAGGIRLGPR